MPRRSIDQVGRNHPRFPRKDPKAPSIWDDDVDVDKLAKLSPAERAALFPNDYAPDGTPYGDF